MNVEAIMIVAFITVFLYSLYFIGQLGFIRQVRLRTLLRGQEVNRLKVRNIPKNNLLSIGWLAIRQIVYLSAFIVLMIQILVSNGAFGVTVAYWIVSIIGIYALYSCIH
jgi:hypothetical protein